ncbi:formate dehydrogenase subunit delta [Streptomyces niger]|uniref:formate dehydrogenase subunit delta n=1 Tax=Streptomyces niger TaxID=66373 RepID=UPI00069A2B56|nr:formate dehydrogenase subunit delta [Streptomyces niger]
MSTTLPPESRMANDIARAFRHLPREQAIEAVAGHIGRFWDPRMRSRLTRFVDEGAEGIAPEVVAAVRLLMPRRESGTG